MKKIIYFILFCLYSGIAISQQVPSVRIIPPSADAANLGKYGTYPTDLSNGLLKVAIPLYTIKSSRLEIPISLSYHGSGIRVNDVSSWVGLGWVLNAGGVLTRSVRGKPDENSGFANGNNLFMNQEQLNLETDKDKLNNYLVNRVSGMVDSESDDYSYNSGNISGNFVYNSNKEIIQKELSNNKIIATSPGISYTIIADDGTIYVFDVTENTTNAAINVNANTSFYLSKIISSDKTDTISFDYFEDNTLYKDVYPSAQFALDMTSSPQVPSGPAFTTSQTYIYTYKTKILSKIRFSGGFIDFIRVADRKDRRKYRLSEIKIYSNDSELKRTIRLNQNYFVSSTPHAVNNDPNENIAYRLKLTGVDIFDVGTSNVQPYTLNYNTVQVLPSYWGLSTSSANPNLYYGQDIFGYYNGVTSNSHLLNISPPSFPQFVRSNRDVVPACAQAAVLTEIQYPTKGRTKFYYESNTTTDQTIGLVGGLRIVGVDNIPGDEISPTERKTFKYVEGRFGTSPWYKEFLVNGIYQVYKSITNQNNSTTGMLMEYYTTNGILPLSSGSNNGIFYSKITEYNLPENGNIVLGKTEYEYEYEDDVIYSSEVVSFFPWAGRITPRYALFGNQVNSSYLMDMGWGRGPLKKQNTYKIENDGSFKLVKSVVHTYAKYKEQISYTGNNIYQGIIYSGLIPNPFNVEAVKNKFQFFDVKISSGVKKLISTTESLDGVSQTVNYFYDNPDHLYLTRIEKVNSRGGIEKQINKYPQDKLTMNGLSTVTSLALDSMIQNNMLSHIIETTNFSNDHIVSSERTNYRSLSKGGKVLIPIHIVQSSKQGNSMENRLNVNNIDSLGNILDLTKDDGAHEAYQWDYVTHSPVVKIINAQNTLGFTDTVITKNEQVIFTAGNNPQTTTINFTHQAIGAVSFNLILGSGGGGVSGATANYTYQLSGPASRTGTLCASSTNPTGCNNSTQSYVSFTNLPVGTYTLTLFRNVFTAQQGVYFNYTYLSQGKNFTGHKEFYYEGFENRPNVINSGGHTGHNYSTNPIVTWTIPNSRAFVISYWFKTNGKWHFSGEQPYTGIIYTMQSADGYDDIRIHPADAHMTTYTYESLLGITSQTDGKGMTLFYDYDEFQRLKSIKDHQGYIIKHIDYHHKL